MREFNSSDATKINNLIQEAAAALLALWPGSIDGNDSLEVQKKPDDTLVTEADYKSNEILCNGLRELFPESTIVSEEDVQEIRAGEGFWLLDPLDGTSSFVNGFDDFAVLVSYVNGEGYVEAGWMAYPARGVTFRAVNGEFSVYGKELATGLTTSSEIRAESIYLRKAGVTNLQVTDLPNEIITETIHSGEAFYHLFTGELTGVTLELGRLGTWDVTAPQAIIEALGGKVVNSKGERFRVEAVEMSGASFIGAPTQLVDEVLKIGAGVGVGAGQGVR